MKNDVRLWTLGIEPGTLHLKVKHSQALHHPGPNLSFLGKETNAFDLKQEKYSNLFYFGKVAPKLKWDLNGKSFPNLNVDQEEPQHAVDAGKDPNPGNDPLGPGDCAHRLGPHWMTDSDVPAHWERPGEN